MANRKFDAETIVTKIMNNIPRFLRKYEKLTENDEIKRRFSVLKRPLIASHVDRSYKLYHSLGFSLSAGKVVEEAIFELTKRVPLIPDFCEIVEDKAMRKQIADSIAQKIMRFKNERYGTSEAGSEQKDLEEHRERTSSVGKVHFDADATQSDTSDKSETVVQSYSKKSNEKIVREFKNY